LRLNFFKFSSATGSSILLATTRRGLSSRADRRVQVPEQLLVIVPRRTVIGARHVQEKHQNLATLDVAEEGVAEANVFVRPSIKPGTSQTVSRRQSG